jgi:(p)ppGpp synthase/HD superfamily hydrolase
MVSFEQLAQKVHAYRPGDDLSLLHKAYDFSATEHRSQTRLNGEPFFSHPLEVANVLADLKLDVVCLAGGMLHDVVEDTPTTIERIRQEFGPDVAHIVEGVTKISRLRFSTTEEKQAENLRKMFLAMVDDVRSMTFAWCWSNWPTGSTTCGPSTHCPLKSASGWRRRRLISTRRSRIAWAWARYAANSKT